MQTCEIMHDGDCYNSWCMKRPIEPSKFSWGKKVYHNLITPCCSNLLFPYLAERKASSYFALSFVQWTTHLDMHVRIGMTHLDCNHLRVVWAPNEAQEMWRLIKACKMFHKQVRIKFGIQTRRGCENQAVCLASRRLLETDLRDQCSPRRRRRNRLGPMRSGREFSTFWY